VAACSSSRSSISEKRQEAASSQRRAKERAGGGTIGLWERVALSDGRVAAVSDDARAHELAAEGGGRAGRDNQGLARHVGCGATPCCWLGLVAREQVACSFLKQIFFEKERATCSS